jgi:hypothetical protein
VRRDECHDACWVGGCKTPEEKGVLLSAGYCDISFSAESAQSLQQEGCGSARELESGERKEWARTSLILS